MFYEHCKHIFQMTKIIEDVTTMSRISSPTNLYIISHYDLTQLNVSKERLTLTTVFHLLLPPGKHWA